MTDKIRAAYILHFERPISPDHTAQHYLGGTTNLEQRIECHRNGTSEAAITRAAFERGIKFEVGNVWETNRPFELEQKLKARKNGPKLCSICNPNQKI